MQTKLKILVAEDDADVRNLVRVRLDMAGYDTHTAHNGREAIERIVRLQPAAVILDINMPELDGFGVLKLLKRDAATRNIPVIVLTARHDLDDVKLAISLGAKDFLSKPFNEGQLMARVARALRPAKPTG
jgi:two-component system OmpR family response regulator